MKNIMYQTIALALGTILIMGCSEEEETPPTDDTGAADVISDAEGSGDVPETDTDEADAEDDVDDGSDTDEADAEDDVDDGSDSDE